MANIPNAEDFRNEKMEEKYGVTDCIYLQCNNEFSRIKLTKLNELFKIQIWTLSFWIGEKCRDS